jgi:mRNA-degrading endonuclease RelE of RelBE toxin-antitoxin system
MWRGHSCLLRPDSSGRLPGVLENASSNDPKGFGKALRHSQKGLWRYRVRDYRIIREIQQERVVVLVVAVGHRSKVYG